MTVSGILETALYVDDLDAAAEFYTRLFGFEVLVRDERLCALSVAGRDVLLLFRRGASLKYPSMPDHGLPPHDGAGPVHVAFSIAADDLPAWERRLESNGIAVEQVQAWPRGGRSLYFRDPDRHLLELATPGVWAIY